MTDPLLLGGISCAVGALLVWLGMRRTPTPTAPPAVQAWRTTTTTTTTTTERLTLSQPPVGGVHPATLPRWGGLPELENQ